MFSAVTLSRSPPLAETTMIATGDRSRIWRHSSNPSASGSIRSSSTMSGCSASSRASTRLPADTTVSKPRTARLERMRSTMFGSSSMMSTFVVTTVLLIVAMGLLRVETTESIPVRQALYSGNLRPKWLTVNAHAPTDALLR